MMYQASFVHPIAGACPGSTVNVELPESIPTDLKALGAILRKARLLSSGQRVHEARPYVGNRFVVWPSRVPGGWFSISLKPLWVVNVEALPEWHLYAPEAMLTVEGGRPRTLAVQRYEALPGTAEWNTTSATGEVDVLFHLGVSGRPTSRRCKRAYINAELRMVMVFDTETLRDDVIRNSWARVPLEARDGRVSL